MKILFNKRILYTGYTRLREQWRPGTKNSRTLSLPLSLKGQKEELG